MNLAGTVRLNKTGFCILIAFLIFCVYLFTNKSTTNQVNTIDLSSLLRASIKAAQIGGKEVVSAKDSIKIESKGKTKEGANDSVTTADYNSHCAMLATLKRYFPSVVVMSEEHIDCIQSRNYDFDKSLEDVNLENIPSEIISVDDVVVWIDPLDATQEYTEKLYQYVTTMVCVAVKGKPIIGVIYKPFLLETSWAWVGKSHSKNLNKMKNIDEKKLKIVISRSHMGDLKAELKKNFENADVIIAAGAGYKVLEVASGRVDAYVHSTAIKKWDICAGNAILNALGGKLTTKKGALVNYADTVNVKNEEGLIATLENHDLFLT